jgi:glycosyltransferase involved in cell wall biosynthesis
MNDALVSIVIPTFNRAYCLPRALDSALTQTHRNVEIIIVDDGSTDGTSRLVSDRYSHDGRVKCFRQENLGVTAARNQGIVRATGEFIALLDSDDVWKPWKLKVQLAAMSRCPELGMVWTDMEAVDPAGRLMHPAHLKQMYSNHKRFALAEIMPTAFPLKEFVPALPDEARAGTLRTGSIYSPMFMGSLVHTSTVLLRRERLSKVGTFNESLKVTGEDYDFHLRTCREGSVGFIDLSSIQYQVGMPDALTHPKLRPDVFANCLTTICLAYERDRDRIDLPGWMIRLRFAEVNAWLGEALLDNGNRGAARQALLRSLRYRFWQPRPARLLALALLPAWLGGAVRRAFREAKKAAGSIRNAFGSRLGQQSGSA